MVHLEARGLGKRFGQHILFKNFTFRFEEGKVYAVTGHNGSGKSTLLRLLAGMQNPSRGQVVLNIGALVMEGPKILDQVSYCSPHLELYEEFTFQEMITWYGRMRQIHCPEEGWSDWLQWTPRQIEQTPLHTFSSGMKQKAKLAIAMQMEAICLFLDEPYSNLDSRNSEWLRTQWDRQSTPIKLVATNRLTEECPEASAVVNMEDRAYH